MDNVTDKPEVDSTVKEQKTGEEVNIYYRRSADHRTHQADGAWAGITPQLDIQVALFKELQPLPELTRHKVADGKLGIKVEERGNVGIEREVLTTVVMNPLTTIQVMKLLTQMLSKVMESLPEELRKQLEEQMKT